MAQDAERIKQRLKQLSQTQKRRHLTASELFEAADLLRTLGREDAARDAEAAAVRQRAREVMQSPDATFPLGEEVADIDSCFCRVCGKQITADEADRLFYHCPDCAAKQP